MAEKGILVVSDLHCGSIYGMLPPEFKTSDDKIMAQNPGQKYIWECWAWLCGTIADRIGIEAVVVNGDVIDGCQRAQRGTELALPMMEDQSAAAEQTLKALQDSITSPVKWYFVQGTEYHDAKAGREAEIVARSLGATRYKGLGTGRWSKESLDLDVDGVVCNFSHGIGVSSGLYRATAPDREGIWSALSGKEGKLPKADAVIRSHAHYFVHVEHPTKHVVVTPCWQLQTRYMRKNSVYRMLPDLGAIIVWLDGAAKSRGEDGVRIEKFLFPLPKVKPVKL